MTMFILAIFKHGYPDNIMFYDPNFKKIP